MLAAKFACVAAVELCSLCQGSYNKCKKIFNLLHTLLL